MNEELRSQVIARAGNCCEYCRMPSAYDPLPFEVDHIIARKHRGLTTSDNLAWSCFSCNSFKGPNVAGIDPDNNEVEPLFHPRQERWTDHFEWHEGNLKGKTPRGRATIMVLEINLGYRVSFRNELIAEGVFPTDL